MRASTSRPNHRQREERKKLGKRARRPSTRRSRSRTTSDHGKERVDEERQVAARKMSSKKGPLGAQARRGQELARELHPDVRPGKPDRAQTRAHPYALYIARHAPADPRKLWGSLPRESRRQGLDYPLTIQPVGEPRAVGEPRRTVHKVTIAKTSARRVRRRAVDTVLTAGPTRRPPRRSARLTAGSTCAGLLSQLAPVRTFNVEPTSDRVPDDGVGRPRHHCAPLPYRDTTLRPNINSGLGRGQPIHRAGSDAQHMD